MIYESYVCVCSQFFTDTLRVLEAARYIKMILCVCECIRALTLQNQSQVD